jgi:hypothetical protein
MFKNRNIKINSHERQSIYKWFQQDGNAGSGMPAVITG